MAKQLKKGASSDMQRVTPTFTTTDHGYDTPHLDRMPPFVLVYNPRRWTVLAGRLIPSLHVKPLEAGVNGVAIARDGTIRFATARARIEEQGRTLIPYEWGPGGESYMQTVRTRPRGGPNEMDTYLSVWETTGPADPDTYTDDDAYSEWAESLVKDGKVRPCPPALARRMQDRAARKLAREEALAEKGGAGSGMAKLRAKALARTVKVLGAAATTKRTGRGKAAAPSLEA